MLVVGLGNPGSKYALTRHNIGFMAIDELVKYYNATKISFEKEELFKFKNHYLLKPQTFMNLSGEALLKVKNYFKIEDDIIVFHDDLDLGFGATKYKKGGGNGGHNGLKSIDSKIGVDYIRVRMGIGKPEHKSEIISYVLSDFTTTEQEHLKVWLHNIPQALDALLCESLDKVSAKFSTKALDNAL